MPTLSAPPVAMRIALLRHLALAGLVLLLAVGVRAQGEDADSGPAARVRAVAETLVGVIERHRDRFDEQPGAYFEAVDETLAGFVNYEAIARAVMARYWADAGEAQRERFIEKFRDGLVRSYGRAMMEFDQQATEVLPVLPEHRRGDQALVRMEITGGNGRVYPVRYSMARTDDGGWQVRNVIVDGVNLGITYRNQFASAMQGNDIDTVIENWSVTAASDD